MDPYFTLSSGAEDPLRRFRAAPSTAGPWSPEFQHGGPPNALAVWVAEQALAATTGRDDLRAVRLAADFVGPVPVGEVTARHRLMRVARSAALVEVSLSAEASDAADGERDCLVSRIWFVRDADTTAVAPPLPAGCPVPATRPGLDADFPYGRSLEWRFVDGRMGEPGPATAWVRPLVPLLAGHDMSSLARAVLIADSASGISAELSWDDWSFLNVDLDVHLFRPISGEWLSMAATTQLGASGAALARSSLADEHGPVGAGLQTLVLSPLRR